MKLKSIAAGALLAVASFGASATQIFAPNPVVGTSFVNTLIGQITVSGQSDIVGDIFAANSVNYGFISLNLDHVTFTNATVGSLVDMDATATGFNLHNVAAGTYDILATGSIDFTPTSPVHGVAFLGANYTVTAVPEPETYGMLLGGLALVGVVARRKAKKAA
ncbi:FxDxF family PEP-CTERM protein [Rugamonas sp. A1-17]|nr:FxDxF family PEP-CTERM protein [Rugamonas sp. A1-17]